jgi:hypothetical protein
VRQSQQEHIVNNQMKRALIFSVIGALGIAAAAPVAMRVEVEPLRSVHALTEVAVIVQIAPMDRGRMGSNAIVRIELDEGRVSSGSPMRAVGIEDDGSFRVVVQWPPGEHDLRVVVEDPSKEDTGLWVGRVRIPNLAQPDSAEEIVPTDPVPVPVPDVESVQITDAAETPDAESAHLNDPPTSDEPAIAAAAAAGAAIAPEPAKPPETKKAQVPEPEAIEPIADPAPDPVSVAEPEAPAPAEMPSRVDTIDEGEQAMLSEPEPLVAPIDAEPTAALEEPVIEEIDAAVEMPEPEPEPMATDIEEEPVEVIEPRVEDDELPLVEPLRADPPPESVGAGAMAASGRSSNPCERIRCRSRWGPGR